MQGTGWARGSRFKDHPTILNHWYRQGDHPPKPQMGNSVMVQCPAVLIFQVPLDFQQLKNHVGLMKTFKWLAVIYSPVFCCSDITYDKRFLCFRIKCHKWEICPSTGIQSDCISHRWIPLCSGYVLSDRKKKENIKHRSYDPEFVPQSASRKVQISAIDV